MQLVVLVAAAAFARRQFNEAKRLREDQTRPFVILDLESNSPPLFYLAVKNVGSTMARNVRFEFDPAPESTIEHADPTKLKMFRDGISTLPPGKAIRTLFDSAIQRHPAGLPDVYEVRVSYSDQWGRTAYSEKMHLDFGLYWNRLSVTRYGLHDMHEELKRIREVLKTWSPSFGPGLLVVTEQEMRERVSEFRRRHDPNDVEEGRQAGGASPEANE